MQEGNKVELETYCRICHLAIDQWVSQYGDPNGLPARENVYLQHRRTSCCIDGEDRPGCLTAENLCTSRCTADLWSPRGN